VKGFALWAESERTTERLAVSISRQFVPSNSSKPMLFPKYITPRESWVIAQFCASASLASCGLHYAFNSSQGKVGEGHM